MIVPAFMPISTTTNNSLTIIRRPEMTEKKWGAIFATNYGIRCVPLPTRHKKLKI